MPCYNLSGRDKDGNPYTAIMCTRGRRPKLGTCMTSGCSRPAEVLCDGPKPDGKTCDKKICLSCAHSVGPNKDFCPVCWVESLKAKA